MARRDAGVSQTIVEGDRPAPVPFGIVARAPDGGSVAIGFEAEPATVEAARVIFLRRAGAACVLTCGCQVRIDGGLRGFLRCLHL